MAYTIEANNKIYIVDPHAAQRMLQRGILENWVIQTLENGDVITQTNGRDRYELQMWIDDWDEMIIIQVIVDEDVLLIISVIDDSLPKEDELT